MSRSSLPGERSTLELVLDELKGLRETFENWEHETQKREERWLSGQERIAKALDTDLQVIRVEQQRLGKEHALLDDKFEALKDRVAILERKASGE